MPDPSPVENFCVLLLEESPTLQMLFDYWLPGITTRMAATPAEIPAEFDESVAVACLCQSTLEERAEETFKQILSRNPYCQLVAILPQPSFSMIHEEDYDAVLQRPIYKDEFQQTISNRLACGIYSANLREFYVLNAKMLSIRQAGKSNEPLPDVDVDQLHERYDRLSAQLNALQQNLSTEDIKTISQSIDLHKSYLRRPEEGVDQGPNSKYHPSRCPNCKLGWGVNHGNELGDGVVSIGAGVWRCTRCREIVHGLGESGRRVFQG